MKKKEILELITINRNITRYKKIINLQNYQNNQTRNELYIENFPFKELFEKEYQIVKKEIAQSQTKLQEEIQKLNQYNCKHLIRTKHTYYEMFSSEETCRCIFCNKIINMKKNPNSIYNDTNIIRNCAIFEGTNESEDNYTEYYTKERIYEIILNIIKDEYLETEIDILNEIKKLNLDKCIVNTNKKIKEYYILIISGSNKYEINNNIILTSSNNIESLNILEYFLGIPSAKIEIFDNQETFNEKKFQELKDSQILNSNNSRYISYKTIEELKQLLLSETKVPFDLIIDMSNSNEYIIENNTIHKTKVDLELDKLFNSSYIISIKEFVSEKEILQALKEELLKVEAAYGMIKDSQSNNNYNYYHLEGNNLEREDNKSICKKLRKLMMGR